MSTTDRFDAGPQPAGGPRGHHHDPGHVATAAVLRRLAHPPRADAHDDTGLVRDLADYDRAFGLIDNELIDREMV